ncbi:uncharacterized protein F5Z01DRAFT_173802 [Emericellopsis atlantica]|uniref:BTB domain-containing protein n=1 Tax=Emericellopsis atlantica TaxID=2614577 RepID=A0A9P7ZJW5_9HYPO|nr:uncharacterized protein F5Z01DRAFT_173802 [Emericellopsis atlantica]KAG9253071.1 hypothetical protein F5Z01DRAFT_173802 [Emericellopsis atlantica]
MGKQFTSLKMSPDPAIKSSSAPARPKPFTRYLIDPKGDTIIVLQNPGVHRVIGDKTWPQANPPQAKPPQTNPFRASPFLANPTRSNPPQASPSQASPFLANPPQANPPQTNPPQANPPQANPFSPFVANPFPQPTVPSLTSQTQNTAPAAPKPKPTRVEFLVSSKHLTLASKYFETMLEGPWSESTATTSPHRVINASEWCPDAFLLVLCGIHGQARQVSRGPLIAIQARVAAICDYY